MLKLTIQGSELWDDEAEVFKYTDDVVLELEHSLVSLSKWEAKYHKLFLNDDPKTDEESFGYFLAMLVTPDVDQEVFERLTEEHVEAVNAYINDPMTGSTVTELQKNGPKSSERISSELIYFWLSQYQIDVDCQTWHLNRLFTLIKIHHAKSEKPKKMNKQSRVQQMADLNAQRKAKLGSKG